MHPRGSLHDESQQASQKVGARLLDAHKRVHQDWCMPFGLPFKDFGESIFGL
jgi:hypothetical protein